MLINTATINLTKMSLYEEDVDCDLQKWERCASP